MTKAIVPGSLSAVAQRDDLSLAESFLSVDVILIVDVSGSMSARDAPGRQMRHEAAADELRALQEKQPGKIAVVAFSDSVKFCPAGVPIRENGMTNMAAALRFVKPADGLGIKFVLISDGEPDSREETLKVARSFKSEINTVFIGPEHDYKGRAFLKKLAKATGGHAAHSAEPGMLAEPVLLLTGGRK